MTHFKRIQTALINPVVLALCTSSAGFAASAVTAETAILQPAKLPEGAIIVHEPHLIIAEGQVEVSHLSAVLTEGEVSIEPGAAEEELAQRFITAMSQPTTARRATKPKAPAHAKREWKCGKWEELWQGRGLGRTCEWK